MGDTTGVESACGGPVRIRVRLTVVCLAAYWGFTGGLFASMAFSSGSATGTALGSLLVATGALLVVRTLRSVMLIDEAGITIRNTWTTKAWTWEQIGEVGWDSPGWARYGVIVAISVCPLGDPYTYTASASAGGLAEHRRQAACLAPWLERHGVANAIARETASVYNWSVDPRSRSHTDRQQHRCP